MSTSTPTVETANVPAEKAKVIWPARAFKNDDKRFDFFPEYTSTANYKALKASILQCGKCLKKIILWRNSRIDGKHRLRAVDELRAEGHDIAEPEIETMEFADVGAVKKFLFDNLEAERANFPITDRVEKIEKDKDLIQHLKTAARARQGRKGVKRGKKERYGDIAVTFRNQTVEEMKAEMVGMGVKQYTEVVAILRNRKARRRVDNHEMSVHEAALTLKSIQTKVVEEQKSLDTKQIIPNYTNKIAGLNTILPCDVLTGIPLADNSVDLIFTSPPYPISNESVRYIHPFFTGDYFGDYLAKTKVWMKECFRVLKGDRYCVLNIDICGPTPEDRKRGIRQYNTYIDDTLIAREVGFIDSDTIIWDKNNALSGGCLEGSREHPRIKRTCEFIVVLYKPADGTPEREQPQNLDLTTSELGVMTMGKWKIKTANRKANGSHVAPFPDELAENVVLLYSHRGDVVLDPFNGSGTTTAAAAKQGRQYIGFDVNAQYCKNAEERTAKAEKEAHKIAAKAKTTKVKPVDFDVQVKKTSKFKSKRARLEMEAEERRLAASRQARKEKAAAKKQARKA